jgi:23S rRNA (cytosine1962-C5)-methyltransferase
VTVPTVRLNRVGEQRLAAGHPWVFRGHITSGEMERPGVVHVTDHQNRRLGRALYNPMSQIALRFLTTEDRDIDATFLTERMRRAKAYREQSIGWEGSSAPRPARNACRQVFAESDGLPSLIVDQYGAHLVVQCLSASMETLKPALIEALEDTYRPESILARNDAGVRKLEGLPQETSQWKGSTPRRIDMLEGDIVFEVDPWHGQKTGAFLDQIENHFAARGYAHGRLLDAFTYIGGFGLACAARATEVVAIDSSAAALEGAARNAQRNGIANVTTLEANVFDFLKSADLNKERFDTVILDPPAFARNKKEVEGGVRGYKEINLRAMKLLNPGGILVTCSCSYHVTEDLFLDVMAAAAADVKRRFRLVEKRTQGRDHPLLVGFPESYYLKCLILQVLD